MPEFKEQELNTVVIQDEILKCESIEELKENIFPMLKTQQAEWAQIINDIIEKSGMGKAGFARMCGVSRVAVDNWSKGAIPKNRETFLKIGMAAKMDIDQINQLLQRHGKYPALYSKSLEDCVCMFVINTYSDDNPIERYQYLLNRIKTNIIELEAEEKTIYDVSTNLFYSRISDLQELRDLEQFIADNSTVFKRAYSKFYAYVKMNIMANYMEPSYAGNIYEMAVIQGWSSSLKQCVSAIRQNKWYPTRKKIISLGLHLSMDHEQIDEMLEIAHMEPLCAKNIFESVIIFILEDASLNDMLNADSPQYDPDELCNYAREILGQLDLPEVLEFISELSEADDE